MTEKEFVSYFGKDVKIVTKDGDIVIGHVVSFTWGDDSDNGEAELDLWTKKYPSCVVGQSEVKSIEVIDRREFNDDFMPVFDKSKYDEAFVARGEKLYKSRKVHYRGKDSEGFYNFYVYGSKIYSVSTSAGYTQFACNCPWRNRNDYCKHEIAVQLYLEDLLGGKEVRDGGIAPTERTFFTVDECKILIQKINRRHKKSGYIDYWHGYEWGNELSALLYECEYIAESGEDLPLALQACTLILINIIKNWDNVDDDGTLCPLLSDCFELLIKYKEHVNDVLKADINKAVAKAKNSDAANLAEYHIKRL